MRWYVSSFASSWGERSNEVLIDPVRHQSTDDPGFVPVCLAHLGQPRFRGVPFVVDLVVVEHHRRRHRREHPANGGLCPRVPIAHAVFLKVLEGFPRPVLVDDAVPDDLGDAVGHLVGVELVTGHHHRVRPQRRRLAQHPLTVGVQDVDALAFRVPPALTRIRRAVGRRGATGAEEQTQTTVARQQPDAGRRILVALRRPGARPVELHFVDRIDGWIRPSTQTIAKW